MPYSYLSHLRCSKTGEIVNADQPQQLSPVGAPLLASYDLEALKQAWHPAALLGRPAQVITLGEGFTPLLPLPAFGKQIGIPDLWMKDESIIPTGSFKARGAAVGVSRARELGVTHFAMPTNGNAGAAWALYGARAGLRSTIVMPQAAPAITRLETSLAGARLYLVDGLISDAGRQVAEAVAEQGLFDASPLKEPYRIEGKKTMGLEIAEQLGWTLPDVILYPTGGGVGLIGIYKALRELQELGWVKEPLPRLVAVQASGCAPIVQAWQQGERESRFWPDSQTLAFGINVPKALGDFLVLDALYRTEGCAVAVDDGAIQREIRQLAAREGSFVCPEGAAAFAAARQLREAGWIRGGERVVVLNTGAGIKYPDAITVVPQRLRRDGRIPA
ncbi:threonine synthase [Aeromonas sp. ASNIH2]|uniref:threonine synthase n=1 Tax=Aeromonas sp. ASNIH2 TaxID=1636607 RepID=UPI000CDCA081|nr:threonine synthase [Aeromonas sp. ASNIH2]AUY09309.1 threonine synthase [Aeromonas sp. ASNIH2]